MGSHRTLQGESVSKTEAVRMEWGKDRQVLEVCLWWVTDRQPSLFVLAPGGLGGFGTEHEALATSRMGGWFHSGVSAMPYL